jgi:hypothetical protein
MKKPILFLSLSLLFASCNSADSEKQTANIHYFDLQGYFGEEETRLQKLNPTIEKTVSVNNSSEKKSIKITDWKKELAIFTDADINKKAWLGQFKINKTSTLEYYTSDQEKIPVKELKVMLKDGNVCGIQIILKNTNALYTSTDTLKYYPDSLYQVNKTQHIKLLTEKRYKITTLF